MTIMSFLSQSPVYLFITHVYYIHFVASKIQLATVTNLEIHQFSEYQSTHCSRLIKLNCYDAISDNKLLFQISVIIMYAIKRGNNLTFAYIGQQSIITFEG